MYACAKVVVALAVLSLSILSGCAVDSPKTSIARVESVVSQAQVHPADYRLLISVEDQMMALVQGDKVIRTYRVSTAKKGAGEGIDSGQTPRGRHAIAEKIGAEAPLGAVFVDRLLTPEIVPANAPGRTPVATRIMRLRGLDNKNWASFDRLIYLHGSPAESDLGTAASGGCIRMSSEEIVKLFDIVNVGTEVWIYEESLQVALQRTLHADYALAVLEESAMKGNLKSARMLCVGSVYGTSGVAKDDIAAVRWCKNEVLQDDPVGLAMLGDMYEQGKGVQKDLVRARSLYIRSADAGNSRAQSKLAQMYEQGIGGDTDHGLAEKYSALAAKRGRSTVGASTSQE